MEDAHDSTIEYNRFSNTGMFGVRMVDAANNLIQGNLIYSIDSIGFGCAIMTSGARTAKNVFRQNVIYDTAGAGLMIRNGRDNVVIGNDVYNNGRFGVELQDDVEPAPKGIVLPTARALDAREQKKRGRTIT
jgi:parallel beta-helix repeat protein